MNKWMFLLVVVFVVSCQKETRYAPHSYSKVYLHFVSVYQNQSLLFDQVKYSTCDSSFYSVKRIDYLLGDINLHGADKNYPSKYLIKTTKDSVLLIDSVKHGIIYTLHFDFGVKPALLDAAALSSVQDMYWPESMGGGYHYLKMDGHFRDTSGVLQGFSMHTGGSVISAAPVELDLNVSISKPEHHVYVCFSVNGLMSADTCYSFIQDGNYTMMNPSAMKKLMNNAANSFSIKSIN